ncbi:MAG: VCBS repeat-containing protein, partial [Prevotellaceae bacterium]|nr:VCBS repeat-containing protein [Prevotellaceae bacterium]
MNRFFIKLFLLCTFVCTVFKHAHAQDLIANDDVLRTGPSQTVRRSIIRNDVIPGETYSWKLITLPAAAQGTAVIKDEYLIFTPATGFHGTFSLRYELSGSGLTDSADITVIVSEHNNPANIIDPDLECYSYMPADLPFGIRKKYRTEPDSGTGDYIDAMTAPLVGDLNGDGKPEIVIMGNSGLSGGGASTQYQYINIYNGQTGARLFRYDFTALGTGYSAMDMGSPYHRSPTILALADLDGDGMGEIVMCHSKSGRVAAFKPVFSGSTITAINRMWEGHDKNGSPVSYKAPATAAQTGSKDYFGYPNPYIADLDADGIPEVIVYNKIYNGATGALLMSWQNSAPTARASSVTGTAGLYDLNSISPVSFAAADTVRKAAMTGRRPAGGYYSDRYLAVPAIADIDGDGQQEIITGNRIHRFNIGNKQDHTQNSYTSTEGPQSVTVVENGLNVTYSLSDGFTRVADIDGDGELDIIVACPGNDGSLDVKIIVYVWSPGSPGAVKACVSFYSDGDHGSFSIPFIGDINGKADGWDGSGWTRKLPEICILGGVMHIDNTYVNGGRTGVSFHPRANAGELTGKFNKTPTGGAGHIAGLTWDASATAPTDRLKISWGMEHADFSDNTGITLFDFDNNNAADLCYRDERTLRVISPAKSGRDYVPLNEVPGAGSSVMFSTSVYSGTAFEYPTIADVNMDGSADIVVTNTGSYSVARSQGWVEVYEYSGHKWAPCPPVWNQGMYDPRQVREDLKINARPVPMLAQFVKNGET